jgi:hypothetical protein
MDDITRKAKRNSILLPLLSGFVESGNRWMTLSSWLFKPNRKVFVELEVMMLSITVICIAVLATLHWYPLWLSVAIGVLLIQRVLEFVIVYVRNFIFNRGRIFDDFSDHSTQGQWLILMFTLNIIQIVVIYAIWYHLASVNWPGSFSQSLGVMDSLYFSVVSFMTIGFGDIVPQAIGTKLLVLTQNGLSFFTLVIVINGLISIHFARR